MYDVTLWTGTSIQYVTLGRHRRRHQKCAIDKNVVQPLRGLIKADVIFTERDSVSISTIHTILTEDLNMSRCTQYGDYVEMVR